jgi:hypothetical protein
MRLPVAAKIALGHHAGALPDHRRQKRAIQTDRREKVLVQRLVPFAVVEHASPTPLVAPVTSARFPSSSR